MSAGVLDIFLQEAEWGQSSSEVMMSEWGSEVSTRGQNSTTACGGGQTLLWTMRMSLLRIFGFFT